LEPASATARSQEYVVVSSSGANPRQITVAVCWRHRSRVYGECTWNGTVLTPTSGANQFAANGIFESQAMLTTDMTCRP